MKHKNIKNYEHLKWLLITLIIVITAIIDYYLQKTNILLRLILIFASISINIIIFCFTKKGKQILSFFHESKIELQKIIWPSKKETLQTTCIVLLLSMIISIILWGLDHIIFRLISFIIALRL